MHIGSATEESRPKGAADPLRRRERQRKGALAKGCWFGLVRPSSRERVGDTTAVSGKSQGPVFSFGDNDDDDGHELEPNLSPVPPRPSTTSLCTGFAARSAVLPAMAPMGWGVLTRGGLGGGMATCDAEPNLILGSGDHQTERHKRSPGTGPPTCRTPPRGDGPRWEWIR